MIKLNDVPQELSDIVCESLTRDDFIALRHTDRQLVKKTQERFNHAFESLTVTCSKAGLGRLEKFVSDPHCKYFVSKVKKLTIHSLTPYRLRELAESHTEASDYYLWADTYVRKALINNLNALPNLKTVIVADFPFRGTVDPPAQWIDDTPFDSPVASFGMPQEPVAAMKKYGEQLANLADELGPTVPLPRPHDYGLEVTLSVFYDLTARDNIKVDLIIDVPGQGFQHHQQSPEHSSF
ncbi:hypothetical protein SLS61_003861 [Didymella pomorum]|jgi:hypothetical protein